MLSIWHSYPAYVNLQRQLLQMNIPDRPSKTAELQALFGFVKKSKKQKDRSDSEQDNAEDDDDDDEYEEGGDDGDDGDEDEDEVDEDDNGPDAITRRDERAKKRADNDLRKDELKTLHTEVTTIVNACSKYKKESSRKDPKTNIADLTTPWSRASRLTGEAVTNARFPGKHTWKFHTAEYSAISLSSYYRYMPTLAAIILAEASAIISYRPALILYQPEGGAAFLRHAFEQLAAPFLVQASSTSKGPIQRTLTFTKGKTAQKSLPQDYTEPPPGTLTWPDGIYNPDYKTCGFSIEEETTEYNRETKLVVQQRALQRMVDYIAMVPSAWGDSTGALKVRDKPALHPDVLSCIVNLVEVRPI